MGVIRMARDVVGTAGLLFIGYIFLCSLKDARRYIRISMM